MTLRTFLTTTRELCEKESSGDRKKLQQEAVISLAEHESILQAARKEAEEARDLLKKAWAGFHSIEHCGAPCMCEPEVRIMCGYCFAYKIAKETSDMIRIALTPAPSQPASGAGEEKI